MLLFLCKQLLVALNLFEDTNFLQVASTRRLHGDLQLAGDDACICRLAPHMAANSLRFEPFRFMQRSCAPHSSFSFNINLHAVHMHVRLHDDVCSSQAYVTQIL